MNRIALLGCTSVALVWLAVAAQRFGHRRAVSVLGPVVCVALVFSQEFPSGPLWLPPLYQTIAGPVRLADLLVGVLAATVILDRTRDGFRVSFPPGMRAACGLGLVALVTGIIVGVSRGATNLFFEWRSAVLGLVVAVAIGHSCAIHAGRRRLATMYATVAGIYALALLGNFLTGGGVTGLATGRTPVFDGPTVSLFGSMAILGVVAPSDLPRRDLRLLRGVGALCAVMVLLSLRRTYLAELVIAIVIVLLSRAMRRRRLRIIVAAGAAVVVLIWQYGTVALMSRLQSFDVSASSGDASVTNRGHIDDVALGWEQIKESPIFGLGVGGSYDASDLGWKTASYAIHNGPLSIWMMFGILGLLAYLWWFSAAVRALKRVPSDDPWRALFARAAFAWLAASFLVSMAFSPWPFGASQLAVHAGALLGACLAERRGSPRPIAGEGADDGQQADRRQSLPV